jgi:hypothetical protein
MRWRAKRDANEAAIVQALRSAGALVWRLDARDMPDLLVGFRQRFWLLEVKRAKGGVISDGQAVFFVVAEAARLPVRVVRSAQEALEAVGALTPWLAMPGTGAMTK